MNEQLPQPGEAERMEAATSFHPHAEGPFPLTASQRRLWFLDQLQPGNPVYNLPEAWRIRGPLDDTALQASLNAIIERHESLRTLVRDDAGEPGQWVLPSLQLSLAREDLSKVSEEAREGKLRDLVRANANEPFNLRTGPLVRAHLFKMDEEDHALLINFHHLISDGWSNGIFCAELAELYAAKRAQREADLNELPLQFADYALWEAKKAESGLVAAQLAFWKEYLGEKLAPVELPTDFPRPAGPPLEGGRIIKEINPELGARLRQFAKDHGLSLFAPLLVCFQTLLYRWTRQKVVLTGIPVANRARTELEKVMGFFVNTLVVKSEFSPASVFSDLLYQTKHNLAAVFANQDAPFEAIVNQAAPARSLAQNPLIQAMFNLESDSLHDLSLEGARVEPLDVDHGLAMFDLTLNIIGSAKIRLEYNSSIFSAERMMAFAGQYLSLLDQLLAHPQRPVDQLNFISAADQHRLLEEWNQTDFPCPTAPVIRCFEEHAAVAPDQVAVEQSGRALSYKELNRQANQLSRRLIAHGLKPGDLAPVLLPRSIDYVVALVAVMKAGGVYVPLDAETPPERLASLMKEIQAKLLIAPAHTTIAGCEIAVVDPNDSAELNRPPSVNLPLDLKLGDLAYCIFTSGSTGVPKGVLIDHLGLANLVQWHNRAYAVTAEDRATLLANTAFDASTWEVWPYLCAGATLCIPDAQTRRSPEDLLRYLAEQKITLSFVPTPMAETLLQEEWPGGMRLRYLLTGGDKLRHWPPQGLPCAVVNHYGPTESSVVATSLCLMPGLKPNFAPPIGRPIDNTRCYILDENQRLMPIGTVGELCISGAGLSRGYLNSPELTKEKFVPHPFHEGARLYRTGDLAKYRPDGSIEFCGRVDQQIKLRGFRIEPAEIEARLGEDPGIKECLVLAVPAPSGEMQLAAFLISRNGALSKEELRARLQQSLPEYMIPTHFCRVPEFPLTPNGKIDRQQLIALLRPELSQARPAPPGDSIEEKLLAIWRDTLGVQQLTVRDNFFEAGGDSILSIRVIARARKEGLQISVNDLFQNQTVGELAAVARRARQPGALAVPEEMRVSPLTPIQHWFFEQRFTRASHWNMAMLLRFKADFEMGRFRAGLERLMGTFDALRSSFPEHGARDQHYQSKCRSIPFIEIDASNVPLEDKQAEIEHVIKTFQESLNLEKGPLIQFGLIWDGGDKPLLLIAAHHLIMDAVSLRILLDTLAAGYHGEERRLEAAAPFSAWAVALQQAAEAGEFDRELPFWLEQLPGSPATLPQLSPSDDAKANLEASEQIIRAQLTRGETEQFRSRSEEYMTKPHELVLAAAVLALARWRQSREILVALESHGREPLGQTDFSNTIGWFTALYPLLFDIDDRSGWVEAVRVIKDRVRSVPRGGVGFGALRYLRRHPALATFPEPQVSFNFLGGLRFDNAVLDMVHPFVGPARNPQAKRPHALQILGGFETGQLWLEWRYSATAQVRKAIESLAADTMSLLRQIIQGADADVSFYTPGDFPDANLSQADLDELVAELK